MARKKTKPKPIVAGTATPNPKPEKVSLEQQFADLIGVDVATLTDADKEELAYCEAVAKMEPALAFAFLHRPLQRRYVELIRSAVLK